MQGLPGPFEGGIGFREPYAVDVTANDTADADTGPNNEQNHPELTSISNEGDRTRVEGRLAGEPLTTYVIDLYENRTPQPFASGKPCDPSEVGEGEPYLATVTTRTDQAGMSTYALSLPLVKPGRSLTGTATKVRGGERSSQPSPSTSEFGPCADVE